MASVGHIALGLAVGRWRPDGGERGTWRAFLGFSALSMLPDADVIAFKLGIPYSAPFGHRGATHSLFFAVLAGVLAALAFAPRERRWRFGLTCIALVASHPLLDAMTTGGLGVALAWPFSTQRYFAPFRPIPVAPIGAAFLSARGLKVALTELLLFSPAWLLALWPRRAPARQA